mgnify:FL=1
MLITKSQLVNKPRELRPHVVILGAGASVAAFPTGDANGKQLPTMDNLVEILDLEPILKRGGVEYKNSNFEDVYSRLYESNPNLHLLKEIEEIVYDYFSSLQLPDVPTLYDHLLMSLRPKDIVATFNWDPFLFDAWNRNKDNVPIPELIHLHGNVRVAHCLEHSCYGQHGMICSECRRELMPTRLLYPVTVKNYNNDSFIKTEWEVLKKSLRQALTLTVFGYSAPHTDKEAVELMNRAWDKQNRLIERVEIIDIKNKEDLWSQWDPLIIRTYLDCYANFYQSRLATYPRRTCEQLIDQTMYGLLVEGNGITPEASFDELLAWVKPLVVAEDKLGINDKFTAEKLEDSGEENE